MSTISQQQRHLQQQGFQWHQPLNHQPILQLANPSLVTHQKRHILVSHSPRLVPRSLQRNLEVSRNTIQALLVNLLLLLGCDEVILRKL